MSNWDNMSMTTKIIDAEAGVYRFQVGNDIAKAKVNLREAEYFENIRIQMLDHFIGHIGNKPTNHRRTLALSRRIYDEVRCMYLKELEKMWEELTKLPVSEDDKLQAKYNGKRVSFCKGTSAEEILRWFNHHYSSTCAAGDFYNLILKYAGTEGFLSKVVKDYLYI